MAAKHHRYITPTEPLARLLDRQVSKGRYASARGVLGAAQRLLEGHEVGGRAAKAGGDGDE